RGWPRRKNHRRAGRRACPLLRGHSQLPRSAADHVRADRALLSALQGPGKGQMGHDRQVARRDRCGKTHPRGDRARRKGPREGARRAKGHAGTHAATRRPSEGTVEKTTKIMSRRSRPMSAFGTWRTHIIGCSCPKPYIFAPALEAIDARHIEP